MAYQVDDFVVIRNANLGDLEVQIIDIDDGRYPVKYYGAYFVDGVRNIITFYINNIIGYANNNNNSSVASNSTGDPINSSNNNLMNLNSNYNSSQNGGRSRRRRKNRRRSRRSRRR